MPSEHRPSLILASGSPRRRELLGQLGISFEVHPADIDEAVQPGETPEGYVNRVALGKAKVQAERHPGAWVLAADTSVILDQTIFGKPEGDEGARAMLRQLSGRTHRVLTAVALCGPQRASHALCTETQVRFRTLHPDELEWYVSTGEPLGKSGSYALQGIGAFLIESVNGSVSGVAGLPLAETVALLREVGFPLPWALR